MKDYEGFSGSDSDIIDLYENGNLNINNQCHYYYSDADITQRCKSLIRDRKINEILND